MGPSKQVVKGQAARTGRVKGRLSQLSLFSCFDTPEQADAFADAAGVIVPERPVDGPSLVWAADAVISAGGTMNREAAVLGVPTWTTFAGELGAVDRELVEQGRMQVLTDAKAVAIVKRAPAEPDFEAVADEVTEEILRT